MMELKKIAYNNIKLLANIDTNSDKFINVRDKIILEEKEKDKDFENITEITDIEYPIFFSFNYILTIPYEQIIENYTYDLREKTITMMIDAVSNIYDIYGDTIYLDENVRIYTILENIDALIFNAKLKHEEYRWYYNIVDYFQYLLTGFNNGVDIFFSASKEFNNKLYGYVETSEEEDEVSNKEDSNKEDSDKEDFDKEDSDKEVSDKEDSDKEDKEYIGDKIEYEDKSKKLE